MDLAAVMIAGRTPGATHRQPTLGASQGVTVRIYWTVGVVKGPEEEWTALDPAPETTCLTPGPEVTTPLPRLGGHGVQMMRTAAKEEGDGGEAEVPGPTNPPATQSMSRDRNQGHGGMVATMTKALAVAPVSSSESSSCDFFFITNKDWTNLSKKGAVKCTLLIFVVDS